MQLFSPPVHGKNTSRLARVLFFPPTINTFRDGAGSSLGIWHRLGKTGLVFLKSSCRTINTTGIKQIGEAKTSQIDQLTERQQTQKEKILHDGTPVIQHFGSRSLLHGDYDERGNPLSRVAPEWYPEVARDCVPTKVAYYAKYAVLLKQERLALMRREHGIVQEPRRIGSSSIPHTVPSSIL